MKNSFTFKKILPSVLIIAVLATGIFSAFGVNVVNAADETPAETAARRNLESEKEKQNPTLKENIEFYSGVTALKTIGSGLGAVNQTGLAAGKAVYNVGKGIANIAKVTECFSGDGLRGCVALLAQMSMEVFAWILGLTGIALNQAINITVLSMGANIKDFGVIEEGWKIFRDLANILIIFSLLFIGIITILRLEKYNTKKLLSSLIVAALLINFSLFFTKVIIDTSNLLAANFYEKIKDVSVAGFSEAVVGSETVVGGPIGGKTEWGGISDSYMQALKLTTLYDVNQETGTIIDSPTKNLHVTINKRDESGAIIRDKDGKPVTVSNIKKEGAEIEDRFISEINSRQLIFIGILGSILFLITAFSFLAVAILLVIRYVVLIFLMMLSPIALAGMILPAMQKYSKMWWDNLFNYAFFAPAYLLITWIVVILINSDGFRASIGFPTKGQIIGNADISQIIINFSIIIALIIFSILLSKHMGIAGSNAVISWGDSARKWGQGVVGRNTVGRAAYFTKRGYDSLQARAEKTRGGRITRGIVSGLTLGALSDKAIKGTLSAGETAKFGSGESYKDERETFKTRRKEVAGRYREIEQRQIFKKAAADKDDRGLSAVDYAKIGSMNAKELENTHIKKHLEKENVAQHLSAEQLEAISKSDEFTRDEVNKIKKARFSAVVKGVRGGDNKSLRRLSDKEVEMLGDEILSDESIIENFSQSQIDGIKKSSKLNSNLKNRVNEVNKEYWKDLSADSNKLVDELKDMKPAHIAMVDSEVLTTPEAIKVYTPAILIELAKKLKIKDRKIIRDVIKKAVDSGNATEEQKESFGWLYDDKKPAGVIF